MLKLLALWNGAAELSLPPKTSLARVKPSLNSAALDKHLRAPITQCGGSGTI
jgi:hypothetical protein